MKVGYQFPVTGLHGRDGQPGGNVFMTLNGITCARRFVTPENPETSQQVAARNALTACSQNFKTLTDAQRATWGTWAQQIPVEILGKNVTLQDMAAYLKSDFWNYVVNSTHLTTAPTAPAGFAGTGVSNVAYASGTTTFSFDLAHNGTAASGEWVVRITPTMASAQRNAKPSDFRLVEGVVADSVTAVAATPQTLSFDNPVLSWSNNDYMEIEVFGLSDDYAIGTSYKWRGQITVT